MARAPLDHGAQPVRGRDKLLPFAEGAAWLLANQAPEGKWDRPDVHRPYALLNTCFALLFLGRATQPLAPPAN